MDMEDAALREGLSDGLELCESLEENDGPREKVTTPVCEALEEVETVKLDAWCKVWEALDDDDDHCEIYAVAVGWELASDEWETAAVELAESGVENEPVAVIDESVECVDEGSAEVVAVISLDASADADWSMERVEIDDSVGSGVGVVEWE
jgi:hypothetical protein